MPPSKTEHLLFFVSDRVLGGKHIFMAQLAGALVESGHSATLVVQKDGQLAEYISDGHTPGVKTVEIDLSNEHAAISDTRAYLATVPRYSAVFATGRHDARILEAVKHDIEGTWWGAFRHSGFPLPQDSPAGRYYDACSLLVLTSQRQIDTDFSHIPDDRKCLMRSTVPARWAARVDEARRTRQVRPHSGRLSVLYTGRLSWEKGIGRAIEAVADQVGSSDCLELHLCGEGPDMTALGQLVDQLNVETRVTFHPFQHDVTEYYALADCLVLPSIAGETGPLSLKEAMAAGIPVVASDIGGIGEFVHHGSSGLLVSPNEPLTTALVSLAQDPALRDRLAAGALQASGAFGTWYDAAQSLVARARVSQ